VSRAPLAVKTTRPASARTHSDDSVINLFGHTGEGRCMWLILIPAFAGMTESPRDWVNPLFMPEH
jgi:hypothetical protein